MLTNIILAGRLPLKWHSLLFFIFPAFISLSISCNKKGKEDLSQQTKLSFYAGDNSSLQKLYTELNEWDKNTHFSDSFPKDGAIDWQHVQQTASFGDSSITYLFPIKTSTSRLDHILVAGMSANRKLTAPVVINYNSALRKASSKYDTLRTTGWFTSFKNAGYTIDTALESIYRIEYVSIPRNTITALKKSTASRAGEDRCSLIFTATWVAQVTACDLIAFQETLNSYTYAQLKELLLQDYNADFNVSVFGNGVMVEGPSVHIATLSEVELSNKLSLIYNRFSQGNPTGCYLLGVHLTSLTILSRTSCNTGGGGTGIGDNPPSTDCSSKTQEQAILEAESAIAEKTYNTPPLPPSSDIGIDENGEDIINETPPWEFFGVNMMDGTYHPKYTAYFKSERYAYRTVKIWKSFVYPNQTPYTITKSSGDLPPCHSMDVVVQSMAVNTTPDKLRATAEIKFSATLKIACMFGTEVKTWDNVDEPMVKEFPASLSWGNKK